MALPSPEALGLPVGSAVAVPVPDEGLTLYRLLRHPDARVEDFESPLTRAQAALRRIPELFRTSVSHWLSAEQAVRRSKERVCYVACLNLRPHALIRVALTEHADGEAQPGHVDVWSHPRDLLGAVVDVVPRARDIHLG